MDEVFNQGIGLVLVVGPYYADSIRSQLAECGRKVGKSATWLKDHLPPFGNNEPATDEPAAQAREIICLPNCRKPSALACAAGSVLLHRGFFRFRDRLRRTGFVESVDQRPRAVTVAKHDRPVGICAGKMASTGTAPAFSRLSISVNSGGISV